MLQATAQARNQGAPVRDLTDDEVAHYRQHGWVKLEQLIPAEVAEQMLRKVEAILAGPVESDDSRKAPDIDAWGTKVVDSGFWRDYHYIARDDRAEPFHAIAFSKEIGRNSRRLFGRDVGVRFNTDFVAAKVPGPPDSPANRPTFPHQDFVNVPFDRVGNHNYWIALSEVTPEMGALQFYSGSHRLGPLGITGDDQQQVLDSYRPILERECQLSEPVVLRPGDATVHSSTTLHCAPSNTTQRQRIGYVLAYMPADSRFTGAHHPNMAGMTKGERFGGPRFPIIYP